MATYLWVALGGALGSVARYSMTNFVATLTAPRFPWGTIIINIAGSFLIGFVAYLTTPVGKAPVSLDIPAFILAGICGGYTAFSSFGPRTLELARAGQWLVEAGGNVVLSVVLCLTAVWAGDALGSALGGAPSGGSACRQQRGCRFSRHCEAVADEASCRSRNPDLRHAANAEG